MQGGAAPRQPRGGAGAVGAGSSRGHRSRQPCPAAWALHWPQPQRRRVGGCRLECNRRTWWAAQRPSAVGLPANPVSLTLTYAAGALPATKAAPGMVLKKHSPPARPPRPPANGHPGGENRQAAPLLLQRIGSTGSLSTTPPTLSPPRLETGSTAQQYKGAQRAAVSLCTGPTRPRRAPAAGTGSPAKTTAARATPTPAPHL